MKIPDLQLYDLMPLVSTGTEVCIISTGRCGAVVCGRDVPCSDREGFTCMKRAGGIMEWTVFGGTVQLTTLCFFATSAGTQGWAVMSVMHDSVRLRIDT